VDELHCPLTVRCQQPVQVVLSGWEATGNNAERYFVVCKL